MDFQILKTELLKGDYTDKNDKEAEDILREKNIPVIGSIAISDVLLLAGKYGVFKQLKAHRDDADPIGNICETALAMFGAVQTLVLGNPDVAEMLGVLVQAGILSKEFSEALFLKATTNISRAEQLGIPDVGRGDIDHARKS